MQRSAGAIMLAMLLALFYGCVGTSMPADCSSYVKLELREQCAYEQAVLSQSPSACYSISDIVLRETCLVDSNNPDAVLLLNEKKASESLAPDVPDALPDSPQVPAKAPTNAVEICMESKKLSRDACTRSVAIEAGDMSLCSSISAGEYRESCISNIAVTKKKLADCGVLKNPTDQQLCRSYASG